MFNPYSVARKFGNFLSAVFILYCIVGAVEGVCFAEQSSGPESSQATEAQQPEQAYRTPLAGEYFRTRFMGRDILIPSRDRGNEMAIALGGTVFSPKQGDTAGVPIFAFYLKRMWEDARLRLEASGVVNDLDAAKSFGHFELIGRFENDTIPFGRTEVLNDKEIKQTSVEWGTVTGSAGVGLRYPVCPNQVDNDLRLQLLGQVGYFYADRTDDTGADVVLPPDTMFYGMKVRGRYDGFRRNLMELPHQGTAAGFDLNFIHREKWADFGAPPSVIFKKDDTQDYLQFSGYAMGAAGIPGLSEKNRVLLSLYGGVADTKSVDRYNAFRLGGGPFPNETDDLHRPAYPGAMFNQIIVSNYFMTNLEYRRELLFFMYLHLRGTYVWADRATIVGTDQVGFKSQNGEVASVGLTSGFFWDSQMYLEYAWDSGFLRNGRSGSGVMLLWSKQL